MRADWVQMNIINDASQRRSVSAISACITLEKIAVLRAQPDDGQGARRDKERCFRVQLRALAKLGEAKRGRVKPVVICDY
jgi:hypothetical protein